MLITLLLQTALAQTAPAQPEMNGQNYSPPIDSEMTLWTDDASLKRDGYFGARLWAHYVKNPLVYEFTDETLDEEVLLGDVLQLDAIGSITFARLRLGVDVPIILLSNGSQVTSGTGLGDLAVDLKGSLMDTDDNPFGLALGGRLILPTATVDSQLGNNGLAGELELMADKRIGDLLLAANLGTRMSPEVVLENVTINDAFFWRGGAGYAVTEDFGLSLDFAGQSTYSAPLSNAANSPIEGLVGGWGRAGDFVLRAGVGTGLTQGVGAPDFRGVFGLAYEPPNNKDTDLDGIYDRDDACPEDPEDKDGWMDEDGCPDPTTATMFRFVDDDGYAVEAVGSTVTGPGIDTIVKDGAYEVGLHAGTYQVTAEANGYSPVTLDAVVPETSAHEVVVTMAAIPATIVIKISDPDGKAAPAQWSLGGDYTNSETGLVEEEIKPGNFVLRIQAEGYKIIRQRVELAPGERKELQFTLEPSSIVVTKEKIELAKEVYFDTGKSSIKGESLPMLAEVAGVLKDYPELTLISIEGHTDSRGSASTNQRLSDSRAAAVRQYLIDQGVEPERLESIGHGESKPLVQGNNEAAWSKNRRVDIVIKERSDQ